MGDCRAAIWQEINELLQNASLKERKMIHLCSQLHDSDISQICIYQTKRSSSWSLKMVLTSVDNDKVTLVLNDVSTFEASFNISDFCILNNIGWGYCEFSRVDRERWVLSVICDQYNEIRITFHSMRIQHGWSR